MIFNSLGSNYNFSFAMKALFSPSRKTDQEELKTLLESKYQGKATLLYKGREAIALAMQILNLPKGSGVAINGYTCYAAYQPITEAGYKIEYLDIPENGLNFSAETLTKAIASNPEIKVVIVQNTLGYPCDMESIAQVCREKNTILIEDLAHSVGGVYSSGKEAGNYGDFVVLSFSQDKIIDAVSGGALIVRNKKYQNFVLPQLAELSNSQQFKDRFYPSFTYKIRINYAWGFGKIYHKFLKSLGVLSQPMGALDKIVLHDLPGWYCRLTIKQFNNLTKNIAHRKNIAKIYTGLDARVLSNNINEAINNSTNLRFSILVDNRQDLINFLKSRGVHVSDIWYDAPIAPEKYLTYTDYKHQCPNAEKVSATMLNLPTHINVNENQAKKIVQEINTWMQSQ